MRSWCVLLAAAGMALAAPNVRAADFCSTCEVQLGFGATYHFWGYTHGLVVPAVLNFDHDRWEFGAFRFTKSQSYADSTFFGADIKFANPYWGFSLSRRLELFRHPHWRVVLGVGASYKTEEDRLSASLWNFAWQGGLRLTPRPGWSIELVARHWSNGGLKLPNHGQDFATLMFSVYPGLIGHAAADN
jgi:Lipid A 3-O-deacylase (PagL)